jgi:hypothetical protein
MLLPALSGPDLLRWLSHLNIWVAYPEGNGFCAWPNCLGAARARRNGGGRRPVVDDDKRAAILDRRRRGESIGTIAAGVKVSLGVVHKALTEAMASTDQGASCEHDDDRPPSLEDEPLLPAVVGPGRGRGCCIAGSPSFTSSV